MPIVIEGLAELSELLTQESPKAAKRYLSKAAEPATEVVLDALKETVPVELGILEEELGSEKHFEDDGTATVMTIKIGPKKDMAASHYGSLQEWGTRFQRGQHWMTRAWESCKNRVLDVFATEAIGIEMDLENKKSR